MKTTEIINVVSCIIIFLTSIYMLFVHYGNSRSQLEKYVSKLEYLLIKVGLIFMSMGTLWGLATIEKQCNNQAVLNIGLAFYMFWNCIRLKRMFISKKLESRNNENQVSRTIDPKKQDFPKEQ